MLLSEILQSAKKKLQEGHNKTNIIRHFEKLDLNEEEIYRLAEFLDNGGNIKLDTKFVESSDGMSDYVVQKVRGKWVCECKGFAFRGKCRHTGARGVA